MDLFQRLTALMQQLEGQGKVESQHGRRLLRPSKGLPFYYITFHPGAVPHTEGLQPPYFELSLHGLESWPIIVSKHGVLGEKSSRGLVERFLEDNGF